MKYINSYYVKISKFKKKTVLGVLFCNFTIDKENMDRHMRIGSMAAEFIRHKIVQFD